MLWVFCTAHACAALLCNGTVKLSVDAALNLGEVFIKRGEFSDCLSNSLRTLLLGLFIIY